MKEVKIIIGLVLGMTGIGHAELPSKSSEYLRKLNEFEAEKVAAVKKEIWQKRVQVSAALKRDLIAAAKKGDLDTANALKAEIDRLAGEVDLAAVKTVRSPSEPQVSKTQAKKDLKDRLIGTTWSVNAFGFKFGERGKSTRITMSGSGKGDEQAGWEWKVTGTDTVELESSDKVYMVKLRFSGEKEAVRQSFTNGKPIGGEVAAKRIE